MTPNELKQWMQAKGKTPTQVAGDTGISLRTIERFLASETRLQPLTKKALEQLMASPAEAPEPPNVA